MNPCSAPAWSVLRTARLTGRALGSLRLFIVSFSRPTSPGFSRPLTFMLTICCCSTHAPEHHFESLSVSYAPSFPSSSRKRKRAYCHLILVFETKTETVSDDDVGSIVLRNTRELAGWSLE